MVESTLVAHARTLREVMRQAVALLRGEGLPPEEADVQRDWPFAGFRWILVDEYQDIDADQYELISALAGRTLEEGDRKLTLFAVGDDDQNIDARSGATVEFIRRAWRGMRGKPAEVPKCRWTTSSSGWPSGGNVRRRQHGLLLLTAHGAKGLEFDHVVVLDGGWDRAGRDEEADAPRRLYYLALTRARQTLSLGRFDGSRAGPGASKSNIASERESRGYAGCTHWPMTFWSVLRYCAGNQAACCPMRPRLPGSIGARAWARSIWALRVDTIAGIRCIVPSYVCLPVNRWRQGRTSGIVGNCATGRGGWSVDWPEATNHLRKCGATPPPSAPSCPGVVTPRTPCIRLSSSAMNGRWSCRSSCSSRTCSRPNGGPARGVCPLVQGQIAKIGTISAIYCADRSDESDTDPCRGGD